MIKISIPYLAFLYGMVLFLTLALLSRTNSFQEFIAAPATLRHAAVAAAAAGVYGFVVWRFRKNE
jgi:hypothetical protein